MTLEFLKPRTSKIKTRKQEVRPGSVMGCLSLLHKIDERAICEIKYKIRNIKLNGTGKRIHDNTYTYLYL